MKKLLVAIFGLGICISLAALADAPVVDLSQSLSGTQSNDANGNSTPAAEEVPQQPLTQQQQVARLNQQMANFTQMNLPARIDQMQQQIQQLQGQLEVQTHELQLLQDQQKSFYQDLNQRIMQLQSDAGNNKTASGTAAAATTPATPAATGSDQKAYQDAFAFLENKKYDQAVSALQDYLKTYPSGQYVVNAHYWLGEIYYLKNKPDLAEPEFQALVTQFPKDQKVPDALLKLALIHNNAGKHAQAKQELQSIVKTYPGTSAAQLATMQLKTM